MGHRSALIHHCQHDSVRPDSKPLWKVVMMYWTAHLEDWVARLGNELALENKNIIYNKELQQILTTEQQEKFNVWLVRLAKIWQKHNVTV